MKPEHYDENKDRIWNSFPVIQTDRLILREIKPLDAPRLYEIWSNPLVNRYTNFPGLNDPAEIDQKIGIITEHFHSKLGNRWAICLQQNGKMIGTIGFNNWISRHGNFAVLGYDLDSEYWRQGIMFEAGRAVLEYGFKKMKLHRIQADISPINTASEKLLLKLGFKYEGTQREKGYWGGKYQTLKYFGKLSTD